MERYHIVCRKSDLQFFVQKSLKKNHQEKAPKFDDVLRELVFDKAVLLGAPFNLGKWGQVFFPEGGPGHSGPFYPILCSLLHHLRAY